MQVIFCWTFVTRQICYRFDTMPGLRPEVPKHLPGEVQHHIALSKDREAQIEEIFNLFDTDGGGTIDRGELDFAMVALGFHSKKAPATRRNPRDSAAEEAMDAIVSDGTVTLDEFSALMMGELSGKDPKESLRSAFALLSRPDGRGDFDGLITLSKLTAVCREVQVS